MSGGRVDRRSGRSGSDRHQGAGGTVYEPGVGMPLRDAACGDAARPVRLLPFDGPAMSRSGLGCPDRSSVMTESRAMPKLSVVIPAYNERITIEEILWRMQSIEIDKEIVVVDDG